MAAAASATSADVPAVAPGTLYAHQRELATLPVPSLEQTLEKLLLSVKPHVTDEEYQHTEAVCREFEAGAGKGLQELLEERGASMPNWVSGHCKIEASPIAPRTQTTTSPAADSRSRPSLRGSRCNDCAPFGSAQGGCGAVALAHSPSADD